MGKPAGSPGPACPAADQVGEKQQDRCADDGGEPGGEMEEALKAMDMEQLRGDPTAQERSDDADHAGDDEAL